MATVPPVVTLLGLIGCGAFATPHEAAPSPTAASTMVELSWDTTANPVTIYPLADSGLVHCRCLHDLPGSGRTTIEPDRILAPYTGFELSGYSGGARTIGRVSADVRCPGCREWSLKHPPAACPDGSPLTVVEGQAEGAGCGDGIAAPRAFAAGG